MKQVVKQYGLFQAPIDPLKLTTREAEARNKPELLVATKPIAGAATSSAFTGPKQPSRHLN
jgi:hypothetical protein